MKDSFYLACLSCSTWAKIPRQGHESPFTLPLGRRIMTHWEGLCVTWDTGLESEAASGRAPASAFRKIRPVGMEVGLCYW